ncbi:hypothetical protein CPB85DRAFT_1270661 [Mucidula mucida]|nr:hypothetical protein CPB85DRAFT_1270661 [Mucidula mucida]
MLMVFTCTRYVIFALSIACNAIIASVAVWNLGFVQSLNSYYPLDNYLTFLGAFGLAVVFAIVSVELIRDRSVTGLVWFECLWLGVLFAMNLVGAAYLSVHKPQLCELRSRLLLGSQACTSNQVLLAFTWIHSALLFWYLALLVLYCLVHQGKDPKIWQTYIKDISNPECFRAITANRPTSPTLPYFQKRRSAPSIVAPKPRRPIPPVDAMAGLQSLYDVEPYRPRVEMASHTRPQLTGGVPTLYSQHVQSAISTPPVAHTRRGPKASSPLSPPPLGNWPRSDILSQPLRKGKERKPPPSPVDVPQNIAPGRTSFDSPTSPNRPRPTGPRTRTTSRPRPPPLDLNASTSKGKAPARNWDS